MSEASIEALSERFDQFMQSPGAHWDEWRTLREDIVSEHGAASGQAARVLCLSMHQILRDVVARTIGPADRATFQKARRESYNLMLVQEAMIGRTDGNVDPVVMHSITSREVQAGRMAADDDLHKLAVAGAEALGPIAPKSGGLVAKVRSWSRRSR